jgi:hypothetical protein
MNFATKIKRLKMNLQRTDPFTSTEFTARRANQIHLSAQNRMKYWNHIYYSMRKEKEKVLIPINRNYKVLKELMDGLNEKTVNRYFLEGKGFNFTFFTHQRLINDEPMPCYFSFLIIKTDNPDFVIVKRFK